MKDQHTKIKGYRDLSQEEIDLMNEIKEKGVDLERLIAKVLEGADGTRGQDDSAEPYRWASIAKTHLQQGLMALTRAVDKPDFF